MHIVFIKNIMDVPIRARNHFGILVILYRTPIVPVAVKFVKNTKEDCALDLFNKVSPITKKRIKVPVSDTIQIWLIAFFTACYKMIFEGDHWNVTRFDDFIYAVGRWV